ncbi:MAG: hypothetical protein R3Y53_08475 [Bacillota bacterium]
MDNTQLLELIYEQYEITDFLELIKKYNLNYMEALNYLKEKPEFSGEIIFEGKSVDVDFFLFQYQKERGKFTIKRYLKILASTEETAFVEAEHPELKTLYDLTTKRNTLLDEIDTLDHSISDHKESALAYIHKNIHSFDFFHLVKIGAVTFDEVESYLTSHMQAPIYIKMKGHILLLSRVKFLWYLLEFHTDHTEELLTKLEVLKDICDFTDIVEYSKRIDLPILLTVFYLESVLTPDDKVQCGKHLLPVSQLRETLLENE